MANVNEKAKTATTATESAATAENTTAAAITPEVYITDIFLDECALFLGIHEKSGTFENDKKEKVDFHNFLVYLAFPIEEDKNTTNAYGGECATYKIKADDIKKVFGCPNDRDWYAWFTPSQWLYKEVDVGYKRKTDSNGNLVLASIKRVDSLE